jgi:hypothetical protein
MVQFALFKAMFKVLLPGLERFKFGNIPLASFCGMHPVTSLISAKTSKVFCWESVTLEAKRKDGKRSQAPY